MSRFHVFLSFFLSHGDKKYRRGNVLFLRRFWVSEKFMLKTKISQISIKTLLSHSTGKISEAKPSVHKVSGVKKTNV